MTANMDASRESLLAALSEYHLLMAAELGAKTKAIEDCLVTLEILATGSDLSREFMPELVAGMKQSLEAALRYSALIALSTQKEAA